MARAVASMRVAALAALAALAGCQSTPAKTVPAAESPPVQPTTASSERAAYAPIKTEAQHEPPKTEVPKAEAPESEAPKVEPPKETPAAGLRELFPLIRADLAAKLVEFDGIVPINCHDPVTPNVYLELVACSPDTREHETLVMTRARASHIHAALLTIGLQPGVPGSWKFENRKLIPIPPRGDGLEITVAYRDAGGREVECPVVDWVINAETHLPFRPKEAGPQWVFAGSVFATRQGRQVYDADGAGTLIGLCTFGSEVISWRDTISPEAAIEEPVWIADPAKVPAAGTPVVVRIRPARP